MMDRPGRLTWLLVQAPSLKCSAVQVVPQVNEKREGIAVHVGAQFGNDLNHVEMDQSFRFEAEVSFQHRFLQ